MDKQNNSPLNQNSIKKIDIKKNALNKSHDKSYDRIAKELLNIANEYCWKIKDYQKATEYYEKSLNIKPNYINALSDYAQHQRLHTKNYIYAIDLYSKVIELNPNFEYAYSRRSFCKQNLKDYNGAIQDLLNYMQINPIVDPHVYISIAIIKFKIEDFKGIIEDCTKAIKLDTKNDCAYSYRGRANFYLKNYNEAIADFKTAYEIEINKSKSNNEFKPFSLANLKYYGRAKFEIQEYKNALRIFEEMIEQYPKHHYTYELIANCYEKLNDYTNYKVNFDKFSSLNEIHLKRLEAASLRRKNEE